MLPVRLSQFPGALALASALFPVPVLVPHHHKSVLRYEEAGGFPRLLLGAGK